MQAFARPDFILHLAIYFILSACSTNETPPRMGSAISDNYRAPAIYQDHRNQQRSFLTSDGQTMAYSDHGKGKVLVMLHGVPTSSWMYRKMIPELQQNLRVITIDQLGFGSSDKPDLETGYSPADHARRVRDLLASLDIPEYSLLVHDMGGLIAWEMLREQPDAIPHLIVLNTIVNNEGFKQPDMKPGPFTRRLMKAYSSRLTSVAVVNKTFSDLGLSGEYSLNESECYGYVAPMREGADLALYQFFTGLDEALFERLESNRTALRPYKGDTLVLWGTKDETLTVRQIPILQDMLNVPDANVHIYPENAHFLAEEIPYEISARVSAFLRP